MGPPKPAASFQGKGGVGTVGWPGFGLSNGYARTRKGLAAPDPPPIIVTPVCNGAPVDDIADTVQILFGPGGHVALVTYGRRGRKSKTIDLTFIAAELASIGIRVPRSTCPPSEVTGVISCDLGRGGRALWISGGGDINDTELGWAIASGLEHGTSEDMRAILHSQHRRVAAQLIGYVEELLIAAGQSRRQRTAFTTRPRPSLEQRSIRDVIGTYYDDLTRLQGAFAIVVERATTEMGSEKVEAWLDAHSFTAC